MEIKRNITINLNPEDIKSIIVEYMKKEKYNISHEDIKFEVFTRTEGFGRHEQEVSRFKGCTITYQEN